MAKRGNGRDQYRHRPQQTGRSTAPPRSIDLWSTLIPAVMGLTATAIIATQWHATVVSTCVTWSRQHERF